MIPSDPRFSLPGVFRFSLAGPQQAAGRYRLIVLVCLAGALLAGGIRESRIRSDARAEAYLTSVAAITNERLRQEDTEVIGPWRPLDENNSWAKQEISKRKQVQDLIRQVGSLKPPPQWSWAQRKLQSAFQTCDNGVALSIAGCSAHKPSLMKSGGEMFERGVTIQDDVLKWVYEERDRRASVGRPPVQYDIQLLAAVPGESQTVMASNNRGEAVGYSGLPNGIGVGETSLRAVLWDSTGVRSLGALPGDNYSLAIDINDHGQVIGESYTTDPHPFLWQNGRMTALHGIAKVGAINNAGQIVGEGPSGRPVLWAHGKIVPLALPPGMVEGEAFGINDSGMATGGGVSKRDHQFHVLRWRSPAQVDTLPGDKNGGQGTSINRAGAVAGWFGLWVDETVRPLAAEVGDWGSKVNNNGEVAFFNTEEGPEPVIFFPTYERRKLVVWDGTRNLEPEDRLRHVPPGFECLSFDGCNLIAFNDQGVIATHVILKGDVIRAALLVPVR